MADAAELRAKVLKLAPGTSAGLLGLNRPELLTFGAVMLACNALMPTLIDGVARDGLVYSLANTFEISVIVWAALYIGVNFSAQVERTPATRLDKVAVGLATFASLLPLGPFTWIALAAFAIYMIVESRDRPLSSQARAGWVFLAMTVPMFWSKRLFAFLADFFLAIDASLVASITQTKRTANLVEMPGGAGFLQIAAPCSSMANVSLAILCWVLFNQATSARWTPLNMVWCGLACVAVVAINVTRISLIGFFPRYYDLLHGPIGSTVWSWLTIIVVFCICYLGARRVARHSI